MNSKSKIPKLADLLFERSIALVSQNITVHMQIDKTLHAGERQSRNPDREISEKEIISTCYKALPKISKMLIFNKVKMGDSVLIHNTNSNLNVIGVLDTKSGLIELTVVTVLRTEKFFPKPGTIPVVI